ncbi:Hypothetical predicted protein [Pelobates cultripes]|uniref:Uncharacterized protein n=1 Tax=Pelobates cultripes TaxID=61616 RepID=A0AAD1WSD0_PELCU|nr:Hypothetical predicted protein [Pelobates cultripes]
MEHLIEEVRRRAFSSGGAEWLMQCLLTAPSCQMDARPQNASLDGTVPEEEEAAKGEDSEEEHQMSDCLSDRSLLHGRKKRIYKSDLFPFIHQRDKKTKAVGKRKKNPVRLLNWGKSVSKLTPRRLRPWSEWTIHPTLFWRLSSIGSLAWFRRMLAPGFALCLPSGILQNLFRPQSQESGLQVRPRGVVSSLMSRKVNG